MSAGMRAGATKILTFFKNLQTVTNKIHATNIDEIMLELSQDICTLFNADRLTIYSVGEDKSSIVSKVKTGLNSFKDLRLPLTRASPASLPCHEPLANMRDVYDEAELKSHSPPACVSCRTVDKKHRLPHQADAGRADHSIPQRRICSASCS
jgi:hypothetical protein